MLPRLFLLVRGAAYADAHQGPGKIREPGVSDQVSGIKGHVYGTRQFALRYLSSPRKPVRPVPMERDEISSRTSCESGPSVEISTGRRAGIQTKSQGREVDLTSGYPLPPPSPLSPHSRGQVAGATDQCHSRGGLSADLNGGREFSRGDLHSEVNTPGVRASRRAACLLRRNPSRRDPSDRIGPACRPRPRSFAVVLMRRTCAGMTDHICVTGVS
jgi:hypothetical protein